MNNNFTAVKEILLDEDGGYNERFRNET